MCNHYKNIPEHISTWREYVGWSVNRPLPPELQARPEAASETGEVDIWPKREAHVVRRDADGALLDSMKWGVPLTLPGKRPGTTVTKQVTNVRNLASPFWRSMLAKPEERCLVPFSSFAEPVIGGGRAEHWFTVLDSKVAAFAGVWRWSANPNTVRPEPVEGQGDPALPLDFARGEREREEGPQKVFAFLTCEPNPLVAPLHPKAMPVILHPEDYQTWLNAEWEEAKALVQPFPSQLMAVG